MRESHFCIGFCMIDERIKLSEIYGIKLILVVSNSRVHKKNQLNCNRNERSRRKKVKRESRKPSGQKVPIPGVLRKIYFENSISDQRN